MFVDTSRRTSTCLSIVPRPVSDSSKKRAVQRLFRMPVSKSAFPCRVKARGATTKNARRISKTHVARLEGRSSASSSNREHERESSRQTERSSLVRDKFKTHRFLSLSFCLSVSLVFNTKRDRDRDRERERERERERARRLFLREPEKRACVRVSRSSRESYANLICVRLRMFITCKESPREGGGAGRYQCLVRSGGVPSRKFEANRGERKKRVVEKQWRNTPFENQNDSPRGKIISALTRPCSRLAPGEFPSVPSRRANEIFHEERRRIFFETKRLSEESPGRSPWKKTIRKSFERQGTSTRATVPFTQRN